MVKMLIERIKNIDESIKKVVRNGFYFCLFICLISCGILFTYELFYNSPDLYYIGLCVFQLGITFLVAFLCCGFAFNEIKEQIG